MGVSEPLLYEGFNRTSDLRKILCEEQHHVCCYCQRQLKGARIEHSYPEHGPDKAKSERLQLEYTNLFASCIDSQRLERVLQHCDISKRNQVIREFIKEEKCQTYFRYILTGEIIPNGKFNTLKEYYDEKESLTPDESDALNAIDVLNLNCNMLVNERKVCLTELFTLLPLRSKEEWHQQVNKWLSAPIYESYIELRLQYLKKIIR